MTTLYIFLDEGGNFDFSPSGTRYFSLSSVAIRRPFRIHTDLDTYKYNLMEYGLNTEYFHCSHDNSHVRKEVFALIGRYLDEMRIDSLLVEKRKTGPALREDKRFYPEMLGYLLRYVFDRELKASVEEVIVITDAIPVNSKKQAIEKGVKAVLSEKLPNDVKYRIYHHTSKGHYSLQVADYCNWAILRKWEKNDPTHYQVIQPAIKSEFDLFRNGTRYYY